MGWFGLMRGWVIRYVYEHPQPSQRKVQRCLCVCVCMCFVNSVGRRMRVPHFLLYLFLCWGCWFQVQPFSIRAHLFLSIYTTKQARAHVFCGPPHHKLLSLIMRRSGVLQRAAMASSRDWERDILDGEASRVMTVQLAPDLRRPRWLTQVQLNRSQPRLDVAVFLSPWAPDRSSDGSSNQIARAAGEERGHECLVSLLLSAWEQLACACR